MRLSRAELPMGMGLRPEEVTTIEQETNTLAQQHAAELLEALKRMVVCYIRHVKRDRSWCNPEVTAEVKMARAVLAKVEPE